MKIVEEQWIHCKNKDELRQLLSECEQHKIMFNGLYPATHMLHIFNKDDEVSVYIQSNRVMYCDDRKDIGVEWDAL